MIISLHPLSSAIWFGPGLIVAPSERYDMPPWLKYMDILDNNY